MLQFLPKFKIMSCRRMLNVKVLRRLFLFDGLIEERIFNQCLKIKNNYSLYKLDELLYTYRVQISFEKINNTNHYTYLNII